MSRYAFHPDAAAQPATQAQPDIDVEDLDVGDDSALLKKRLRPASPRRSEVAEGDRELAVSVGKLKGPTRTKLKEVTQIFTSWNPLTSWLRQVDRLRHAAA